MGESAAETVREIEQVRTRLDDQVHELEGRLPAPLTLVKRVAGVAAGGGFGGTMFWFAVRRLRNRRAAKADPRRATKDKAQVSVVEFALPRIDESARPVLLAMGAVWLVLRAAQLREARRTNRLLMTRA